MSAISGDGDGVLRLLLLRRRRRGAEVVGYVDNLNEEAAARAAGDVLAGGELLTGDLEQVACDDAHGYNELPVSLEHSEAARQRGRKNDFSIILGLLIA